MGPGQAEEPGGRSSQGWDHLERSPGHLLQSRYLGAQPLAGLQFPGSLHWQGALLYWQHHSRWGCEPRPCPPRTGLSCIPGTRSTAALQALEDAGPRLLGCCVWSAWPFEPHAFISSFPLQSVLEKVAPIRQPFHSETFL